MISSILPSLFGWSAASEEQDSKTTSNATSKDQSDARAAPTRRTGRKGKRAWRTNIDTADVDEAMERLEAERIHLGAPVASRADNDLFVVDSTGMDAHDSQLRVESASFNDKLRSLKSFDVLRNKSMIEPVASAHRAPSATPITNANSQPTRRPKLSSRKERASIDRKVVGRTHAAERSGLAELGTRGVATTGLARDQAAALGDLWDSNATEQSFASPASITTHAADGTPLVARSMSKSASKLVRDFGAIKDADARAYLAPVMQLLAPAVRKPTLPKLATIDGDNRVNSVKVAVPGASYNPTHEDHQALLQSALDDELAKEAERLQLKMMEPTPAHDVDPSMDVDIFDGSDESDDDNATYDDVANDDVQSVVGKDAHRTTRTERNKARQAAEKERQQQLQVEQRKLLRDLNRIKELSRELDTENAATAMRRMKKDALQKMRALSVARQRLGPRRYKAPASEIKLTEELSSSLRELVPEGSVVRDRFDSLQRRGLVETRVRVGRTRPRFKSKVKESHDYKRFS